MGKVDTYKDILKGLYDWDQYLLKESGLPGPRANLELLEAVVEVGNEDTFTRYAKTFDSEKAPTNSPKEFLAMCGVAGFGKLIFVGKIEYFKNLRSYAKDIRWRIREGVVIALQHLGESNIDLLINEMTVWSKGNLLERRAVVAALCEPKLLIHNETAQKTLKIIDNLTMELLDVSDRKAENFKILRKALGYGWSVAVVAAPEKGKSLMEKWFSDGDKDIRWIMKENLRKARLTRMDKNWTIKWKQELGVK